MTSQSISNIFVLIINISCKLRESNFTITVDRRIELPNIFYSRSPAAGGSIWKSVRIASLVHDLDPDRIAPEEFLCIGIALDRQRRVPVIGNFVCISIVSVNSKSCAWDTTGRHYSIRYIDTDGCIAAQCIDIYDRIVVLIQIDIAHRSVVSCPQLIIFDLHIASEM